MHSFSKFKYTLVIIVIFTLSCQDTDRIYKKSEMYHINDISFPIDYEDFSNGIFKYSETCGQFHFLSTTSKYLKSYTTKGSIIDSINLTSLPTINDIYVLTKDSIFLSLENKNELLLINRNGDILMKYNFKIKNNSKPFYIYNYSAFPLVIKDSLVFTYHYFENETEINNLPNYFSSPRELVFNLHDSLNLKYKMGKFPTSYIDADFSEMNPQRTFGHDKYVLYSFEASDSIFIYNSNGIIVKSLALNSNMFNQNTRLNTENIMKENYFNEIIKYTVENDRFANMVYIPEKNVYVRALKRGVSYSNNNGTKNRVEDCPWFILVYNENFNLINTIEMGQSKFIVYLMVLADDGNIYVPYLKNDNKNETHFAVFNFF